MSFEYRKVWDQYAKSWSNISRQDRISDFEKVLAEDCVYTDPQVVTHGHEELMAYMQEFQQKVPGGYFETVRFEQHHNQSLAHWVMKDSEDSVLGDGRSHAEYDDAGRLTRMTGFFE